MKTQTPKPEPFVETLELDELQLEQIRGGQSGPSWELVWAGGNSDESR